MKTTAKLIIAAAAALALLTACGSKSDSPAENGSSPSIPDDFLVSTEKNTPDKVVGRYDPDATVTTSPEDELSPTDDASAQESSAPSDSADTNESSANTNAADSPDAAKTEPADKLPDTEAMKYLKTLNSKHVHAKLTHMYSFDGDELMSVEREFYVNGGEKIYINDGNKTFIRDGNLTYVDCDSEIFYTYPDDTAENGSEFGFPLDSYVLISKESADGSRSELYSITGERIASTWEFLSDGRIKVSDRSLDTPAFDYYIFELIEDSGFKMDFTIPDNFTEVNAEEYGFSD